MRLNRYQWVMFDADETLFHFDAFAGLRLLFSKYNIRFSQQDYHQYQQINKPLWAAYQQGKIDADTLKHRRFDSWAIKLNCTTQQLNSGFLNSMAEICQPLPGARQLIDGLSGKVNLGIITNGFTQLQSVRLQKVGFTDDFQQVIISEEVGVAKPDKGIFDYSLARMGQPEPSQVLMVGDNLDSDIAGGNNAGFDTCWLNHHGKEVADIKPHHQVANLNELHEWLFSQAS